MTRRSLGIVMLSGLCAAAESSSQAVHPMKRLPQDRAGEVVARSIAFAGEWESWQAKETVRYRKTTIRYAEDGTPLGTSVQVHQYRLRPSVKMRVEEERDGERILLINDGDRAWKFVNGEVTTAQRDRDQAWNSTFGSHYVFCMPFKLTDPGARLSHEGETTLPDGTSAETVVVRYEPGTGSAGGMHTWTYYFDSKDARLVANHLRYGPGPDENSFTEYTDYQLIEGIRMPTRRYGYASTPENKRLHKVSEIFYEEVDFDVELADSLFEPGGHE